MFMSQASSYGSVVARKSDGLKKSLAWMRETRIESGRSVSPVDLGWKWKSSIKNLR